MKSFYARVDTRIDRLRGIAISGLEFAQIWVLDLNFVDEMICHDGLVTEFLDQILAFQLGKHFIKFCSVR